MKSQATFHEPNARGSMIKKPEILQNVFPRLHSLLKETFTRGQIPRKETC